MATLKIDKIKSIKITPLPNKTALKKTGVLFRLPLDAPTPYESIEFELSSVDALRVANAVQQILASGSSPLPPSPVPSGRRPTLRIVK
jgi:hypothetical protein